MPLQFFLIASKKLLVFAEVGLRTLMLQALSPSFHKWLEASVVGEMSDRDDLRTDHQPSTTPLPGFEQCRHSSITNIYFAFYNTLQWPISETSHTQAY